MSTSIFIQIGQIMFPLIAIVSIGIYIGKRHNPQLDSVNNVNLNVFIPALVFYSLTEQNFNFEQYALLAIGGLALVLFTALIAFPVGRMMHVEYKTIAPPLMFHNAGNVGLPLLTLALGPEGLAAGLILFLVGNITHFGLGSYMLDHNARWLRSITSPAIIAAVCAFLLQANGIEVAPYLMLPVQMLGNIAVPLMLFSLGVRLAHANVDHWRLGSAIGLLTPLIGIILAFIIISLLPLDRTQAGALLLFGALPPAVMNFLFAEHYVQEPTKVSAIVLFGNVLAIFTLPLALLYVLPRFG